MKLFPDPETKKRFMKTGLPVILGVAWAPIIWLLVLATLGPMLYALTASWPATHALVMGVVMLASFFFLRLFMRIGDKFYDSGHK